MHPFLLALIGGMMIGMATVGYLYSTGRVVGISGMLSTSLQGHRFYPAVCFLFGIALSAIIARQFGMIDVYHIELKASPWLLAIAGALVGLGTSMGSGCTSGHGVCGIARLSLRSAVATVSFIITGVIAVAVMQATGIL